MTYDSTNRTIRLTTAPVDIDGSERAERLRQLGLGANFPAARFDEFAQKIGEITGAPYAMVNFIDEENQYFAGLFANQAPSAADPVHTQSTDQMSRVMERDHGYCPHVVGRRKALVLEDVCDYPRFSGDIIMDEIGIRSYLGAPLIDRTGTPLGTVCAADVEPRPWGRPGLHTIKDMAAEVIGTLHSRERAQSDLEDF